MQDPNKSLKSFLVSEATANEEAVPLSTRHTQREGGQASTSRIPRHTKENVNLSPSLETRQRPNGIQEEVVKQLVIDAWEAFDGPLQDGR